MKSQKSQEQEFTLNILRYLNVSEHTQVITNLKDSQGIKFKNLPKWQFRLEVTQSEYNPSQYIVVFCGDHISRLRLGIQNDPIDCGICIVRTLPITEAKYMGQVIECELYDLIRNPFSRMYRVYGVNQGQSYISYLWDKIKTSIKNIFKS